MYYTLCWDLGYDMQRIQFYFHQPLFLSCSQTHASSPCPTHTLYSHLSLTHIPHVQIADSHTSHIDTLITRRTLRLTTHTPHGPSDPYRCSHSPRLIHSDHIIMSHQHKEPHTCNTCRRVLTSNAQAHLTHTQMHVAQ